MTQIAADLVVLAVVWHLVLPLAWRWASPFVLSAFYGVVGICALGMRLDVVLLVAAVAVAICAAAPHHPVTPWRRLNGA